MSIKSKRWLHHTHCDAANNIVCERGWIRSSPVNKIYNLNPCPIPVCDWNGQKCSQGRCNEAQECICNNGGSGKFCNQEGDSHYTAYWVAVGVTAGVLLAIGIIFYLPRCHSRMNPVQVKRKAPGSPFTRFLSHN